MIILWRLSSLFRTRFNIIIVFLIGLTKSTNTTCLNKTWQVIIADNRSDNLHIHIYIFCWYINRYFEFIEVASHTRELKFCCVEILLFFKTLLHHVVNSFPMKGLRSKFNQYGIFCLNCNISRKLNKFRRTVYKSCGILEGNLPVDFVPFLISAVCQILILWYYNIIIYVFIFSFIFSTSDKCIVLTWTWSWSRFTAGLSLLYSSIQLLFANQDFLLPEFKGT